jgi:alanine racemase
MPASRIPQPTSGTTRANLPPKTPDQGAAATSAATEHRSTSRGEGDSALQQLGTQRQRAASPIPADPGRNYPKRKAIRALVDSSARPSEVTPLAKDEVAVVAEVVEASGSVAARGAKSPAPRTNPLVRQFGNGALKSRLVSPPRSKVAALAQGDVAAMTPEALQAAHVEDLVAKLDRVVTRSTLDRQNREADAQLQVQLREAAGAVATVDLGAGRRNYRDAVAKLGPEVTPTAVIKADGYGQGATEWAKVLIEEGCKDFFVARIIEGIELRKGLRAVFPEMADKVAINVLDGNLAGADPQLLIDHKITPVLNSLEQVQEWNAAAKARKTRLPAILQFDSGMHRAGMRGYELEALLDDREGNLGSIEQQFIMTHLARSDEATPRGDGTFQAGDATEKQLANFNAIMARFPSVKSSIGASSTVLLDKKFHKDYVRLGAAFHAQDPIAGADNPYQQVLTLRSRISEVHREPAGVDLGYGGRYTTTRPTDVAVIPIGYADGPPRAVAGNHAQGDVKDRAHVVIKGRNDDGSDAVFRCPMIGATSMDSSMIDVTDVPEKFRRAGTVVTLMGDGITPNGYGAMHGTNPSETPTKLAKRVFIEYKDDLPKLPLDTTPSANVWGT